MGKPDRVVPPAASDRELGLAILAAIEDGS